MSILYRHLLKQHIGSPAKPLVAQGERVMRGQLIALGEGLSANLHASLSGEVCELNSHYIAICGEPDSKEDYIPLKSVTVLERIKEAGIVGMGGAGFPTHVKLENAIPGGVVIANGAECEPLLAHNIRQMETRPDEIYRGLCYAMEAVKAEKGVIAVKLKHKEAIKALARVIKDPRISLFYLRDLYPMGEERALVREISGIKLMPGQLPSSANALIMNVETLGGIARAVEKGQPFITKNVTVAGRLKDGPKSVAFMDVPLGTPVRELIEAAGGIDEEYGEILMGGPFTGNPVTLEDVVLKTTGGILVTMPFLKEKGKMGLLVCGCGASEKRMRKIAEQMGSEVVAVERCKQAAQTPGGLRCENPGICPGQAQKLLSLKRQGAEALLMGNCSDCSNTVMQAAPRLGLRVHHVTDGALRAGGLPVIRRLKA